MSQFPQTFKRNVWVYVASLLLANVFLADGSVPDGAPKLISRGEINALLHGQSLSHFAFHSEAVQQALASLFLPQTIAIVGVEWGSDLQHFAASGYRVLAIEPASKFVTHLRSVAEQHPTWDVTVFPFAAGNKANASIDLRYDNEDVAETVSVERLDDHVDERLAVLSADVQGDELAVLQGSARLLRDSVASVWVEAIACNDRVSKMLELLDEHFVLFDFVPWGMPSDYDRNDVPKLPTSFVYNPNRPTSFEGYLDWMCSARERGYKWLQTDFLGVRRDLVQQVWPLLASLATDKCPHPKANCFLRDLQASSTTTPSDKEKQEL